MKNNILKKTVEEKRSGISKVLGTRFVVAVHDLKRSAEFYRDVLGFEIQEIGDPDWRFFTKDQCCIMAGECPDALPIRRLGDHSYFAYLMVSNIDEYFERVSAKGAEIIKPLQDEPWFMREFGIRTVDGHRMMFGSLIGGGE